MTVLRGNTPETVTDIMLGPGEFYFGGGRVRINTLLGSCVAITLWQPTLLIGGMCHFLLPGDHAQQGLALGYYAEGAVKLFLQAIKTTATRPREYEVKVFGGGNMFNSMAGKISVTNVSKSNIDAALCALNKKGFVIKASDVGGSCYRKIYMELWTGDVWVKRGVSANDE